MSEACWFSSGISGGGLVLVDSPDSEGSSKISSSVKGRISNGVQGCSPLVRLSVNSFVVGEGSGDQSLGGPWEDGNVSGESGPDVDADEGREVVWVAVVAAAVVRVETSWFCESIYNRILKSYNSRVIIGRWVILS